MHTKISLPKVAVLLATYNGLKHIEEQIQSILNQQHVDITIIANDDFSTDGTWEYLQKIKSEKFIVHERTIAHKSASGNFFKLITESDLKEFDYVSLSDQDDIWMPDKIFLGIQELIQHKADAVSSDVLAFWPNNSTKYIRKSYPLKKWDYLFEAPGPGCSFLISKNLIQEISLFLNSKKNDLKKVSLHDWLIYAYARSNQYRWHIINKSTLDYRQHQVNVIGANTGYKAILKRIQLLHNGWYLKQIFLVAHLCSASNDLPIEKLKNLNMRNWMFLIFHVNQLRRSTRDQLGLAVYFTYLYFSNSLSFIAPKKK